MKNVILWIKTHLKAIGIVIAAILLVVIFFSVKSCVGAKSQALYWEGVANTQKVAFEKEQKLRAADYTDYLKDKVALNKTITSVNAENNRLRGIIEGNVVVLTDLEAARKKLTDKDAIIANLDQQIAVYKVNEVTWEDRYNGEHGLRLKLEGDMTELQGKYEALWNTGLACKDALKSMTVDRDKWKKAAGLWPTVGKAGGVVALIAGAYFGGKALKAW